MFEWLVPATFNYLRNGRDMKLSIPFSEPHLFTSMLRILRAVLGIDDIIAKEQQQKQAGEKGKGEKGRRVFKEWVPGAHSPFYPCPLFRISNIGSL